VLVLNYQDIAMQKINLGTDFVTYFNCGSAHLKSEAEVLGSIVRTIIANKKSVTNKAIIAYLIAELESTNDVILQDCLRSTLQLVLTRTPDDNGI
jgi:hypothetical protein